MMTATTREFWIKTVKSQVIKKLILPALLMERNQLSVKGGTSITGTLNYTDVDELMQEYPNSNTPMRGGTKDFLTKPNWKWKKGQLPVEYEEEAESENRGGSDTAPVDLVSEIVKTSQRGARIAFLKWIYGYPSATSDGDMGFQGLADALTPDLTYGTLARNISAATRPWWQPGVLAASSTDHQTAITASIANYRAMMAKITPYADTDNIVAIMGSALFNSFRSQVEVKSIDTRFGQGRAARYGFAQFFIDDTEFIRDPYLDLQPWGTSANYDTTKWFFLVHLADWELRFFPGRDLRRMTPFKYQGETVGGFDKYMARILVKGNFICWQPRASMWRCNMSP